MAAAVFQTPDSLPFGGVPVAVKDHPCKNTMKGRTSLTVNCKPEDLSCVKLPKTFSIRLTVKDLWFLDMTSLTVLKEIILTKRLAEEKGVA